MGRSQQLLADLSDRVFDFAVAPGYTRVGYHLRELLLPRGPLDLAGRVAAVTGASSGIGEAACVGLTRAGANVLMLVRDGARGEQAQARIRAAVPDAQLELIVCDVSSLASVRAAASELLARRLRLDVLVNNAGVMPATRIQTEEGFELGFATNVLGPFLLTALLLPALAALAGSDGERDRAALAGSDGEGDRAALAGRDGALAAQAGPGRVITVSSGGMYGARLDLDDLQLAHRDYDPVRFYAHTKRVEVALTQEWARRLDASRVVVNSMHPGWVATPGLKDSLPTFDRLLGPILRDPAAGADTIVWLAGSPEGITQSGAFWHDRRPRPKHRVPSTRESAAERAELFDRCAELCGLERGSGWLTLPLPAL